MGLAEITPGISGATVAGLFNVYNKFVKILSFFSPSEFEFSFKKIKEIFYLGLKSIKPNINKF